MSAVMIQAVVRHLLTAVAGGFAVKYGIDGAQIDVVIGGIAGAAGIVWSIYDKKKALGN